MSDLTLAGSVTRAALALADLNLNDYVSYYLSSELMGGQERWVRNTDGSAYMDGEVTINRHRGNITERVGVEVMGSSQSVLDANILTLKQAFYQDSFQMTLTINSSTHTYQCEAADMDTSQIWVPGRQVGRIVLCVFDVPRRPIPIAGGY
jgi:hypothetical protein